MNETRPVSIIRFEWLFFVSFAVTAVDMLYHREFLFDDGGELGFELALILAGVVIFSFGIQIALWFFITHRASSIARTIYAVFWALGFFALLGFFDEYTTSEIVFSAITQLLILASIIFLYRPDADLWLLTKGRSDGENDKLTDVFK